LLLLLLPYRRYFFFCVCSVLKPPASLLLPQ